MTITAKLIAYSQAPNKQTVATFELDYPRWIHGEVMTHRMFSRNAMSSRAVPVEKMIAYVRNEPASPVHWGKNQPGMQAKEELVGDDLKALKDLWLESAQGAAYFASLMNNKGAHKQVVNRILEPFQTMKTVVTSTEWDNFFYLRNHEEAQPEIKRLAEVMLECFENEDPVQLTSDDWHTPYFGEGYWLKGCGIPLEDALAISSSCCAQVSFRQLDDTLEKAKRIYERLVESKPVHASPFEHQCKPIQASSYGLEGEGDSVRPCAEVNNIFNHRTWQEGVTHSDRNGSFWSGNFKGFIQHRKLIAGNCYGE